MTARLLELLAVTLAGGLLILDRVAFLQSLVSRPLPTSLIIGLILGEPLLGLMCGVTMELVWLSRQPVGGSVPPDETLAALAAVVGAASAPPEWSGYARAAAGALIGLPYGLLGRRLDLLARKANAGLVEKTRAALERGDFHAPGRAQLTGAAHFFAAGLAGSALAALTAGWLVSTLLGLAPGKFERTFAAMAVVMPLVGAGALVGSMNGKKHALAFLGGALGAAAAVKAGFVATLGAFKAKAG